MRFTTDVSAMKLSQSLVHWFSCDRAAVRQPYWLRYTVIVETRQQCELLDECYRTTHADFSIVAPVRVRRTRTTRTRCVPVRTRFCVMTSGVLQTGAARNKQL